MKDIPGFPHYQITEDGRVWSKLSKKFMKPTPPRKWPYESYCLYCKETKRYFTRFTHRLLALTYIPNPDNLPFVDHIDRDKTNNSLSNLRWVTQSQNTINSRIVGKLGFRHIYIKNRKNRSPYYAIQIERNQKQIYQKCFSTSKHCLQEVVKYRNEVVYPQFNIEIDD